MSRQTAATLSLASIRIVSTLKRTALQLLKVDQVRRAVAGLRFLYFVWLRKRLRGFAGDGAGISPNTVRHNITGLADVAVARSNFLIRPLSVIETLTPEDAEVLVIGPRTEGEILNLVGHGFRRGNIYAVDLISYSPWIELANMHSLPYPEDSFDAVLMGWVLAYSSDRERAAREVIRTARDGAIVAVGVEYHPLSDDEIETRYGYRVGGATRIESVAEILRFFEPHVGDVYFAHDVAPERRDRVSASAAIFSMRKPAATPEPLA